MMFDPTIYDNLKVVLEGLVYDLDLEGKIVVTSRSDTIDMAKLSRSFRIRFRMRTPADADESDSAPRNRSKAGVPGRTSAGDARQSDQGEPDDRRDDPADDGESPILRAEDDDRVSEREHAGGSNEGTGRAQADRVIPSGARSGPDGSARAERTLDDHAGAGWGRKAGPVEAVQAEIALSAEAEDLAGEIMGIVPEDGNGPGCSIVIRWMSSVQDAEMCATIHQLLQQVWESDHPINHRITYDLRRPDDLEVCSELDFQRKINERQIDDLPQLVALVLRALHLLHDRVSPAE